MYCQSNKDAYVFIPQNLDIDYIKGFMKNPKAKDIYKIYYLIDTIISKHYFDKTCFQGYVKFKK